MLRIATSVTLLALAGCAPEEDTGDHHHDPAVDAGVTGDCLDEVGVICTVAGDGEPELAGDGGPATAASVGLPLDVAFAADGTMIIVDFYNSVIRAVDPDTGIIRRIAGSGELGASGCEGSLGQDPLDLCLNHPTTVAFDGQGQLLVAGYLSSRLFRIDLGIGRVTGVLGTGQRSYRGDEGPAAEASFDLVTSAVPDGAGGIYLTDQENQLIRYVDPDGVIHRHAGRCIIDLDVLTGEELCQPDEEPVACPDSDKVTCGDPAELCVRPCTTAFAGDGGGPLDARFAFGFGEAALEPKGQLLRDPAGDLYVSDSDNGRVRVIGSDGTVRTVAGNGEDGSSGDGGPATQASLRSPADLALGDDGSLFIADPWAMCVRRVAPDGTIDTVAGVCGERGFEGDGGPATEALLKVPFGLAVAGPILYIADTGNQRVRAVRLR
jgi:hypothetical protein